MFRHVSVTAMTGFNSRFRALVKTLLDKGIQVFLRREISGAKLPAIGWFVEV